jgi:hypothetical protein
MESQSRQENSGSILHLRNFFVDKNSGRPSSSSPMQIPYAPACSAKRDAPPRSPDGLHVVTHPLRGASLITTHPLAHGQPFFCFQTDKVVFTPTFRTIQIDRTHHVEDIGLAGYLNHSCAPNVHIDVSQYLCYAARDIAAGEELTFFYPSTEWMMARPFPCTCGAPECIGFVAGAYFLPVNILSRYVLNDHIIELALEHLSQSRPGRETTHDFLFLHRKECWSETTL